MAAAIATGPHVSAMDLEATQHQQDEVAEKVKRKVNVG